MRLIVSLLLFLVPYPSTGCECVSPPFFVRYQESDFIATAKILKVSGDERSSEYRTLDIEITEMYKGSRAKSIQVLNANLSGCGIVMPENSTWLIFATKDTNGHLKVSSCSGNVEIKDMPYDREYPNYKKNVEAHLSRTLEILRYLKKENLNSPDQFRLRPNFGSSCLRNLSGTELRETSFSVYELTVKKDLTISGIKQVRKFDSNELSSKLFACVKENITINNSEIKQISAATRVLIIFFYYPREGKNESFVSLQNL